MKAAKGIGCRVACFAPQTTKRIKSKQPPSRLLWLLLVAVHWCKREDEIMYSNTPYRQLLPYVYHHFPHTLV